MKRCELIGNVFTIITLGAIGTAIIGWPVLESKELIATVLLSIASGAMAFIMDKIANE